MTMTMTTTTRPRWGARTLSDVRVVLRLSALTSTSTDRESIFVRDRSSDVRVLFTFSAAANLTHARPSTPFHDMFSDTTLSFTYRPKLAAFFWIASKLTFLRIIYFLLRQNHMGPFYYGTVDIFIILPHIRQISVLWATAHTSAHAEPVFLLYGQ